MAQTKNSYKLLAFVFILTFTCVKSQTSAGLPSATAEPKESLAIIAITSTEVLPDQIETFIGRLASDLSETQKFELLSRDETTKSLAEAKLETGGCYSVHCLSEAAKILGVQKVLQGNIIRRGKLFRGFVKVVDPVSTSITFSKTWEFSGGFDEFLGTSRSLAQDIAGNGAQLQQKSWLYVAAAVLTLGVTIYLINRSLGAGTDRGVNFEDPGGGQGPPPPGN